MRGIIASTMLLLTTCALRADDATRAPANFGVVVPQGIYRGAQPGRVEMMYLKELGVRTIVKLNHHDAEEERQQAQRLGMRFVHVPFDASSIGERPSCADVAATVEILADRSSWPVYVHCSRGRDRTGFIVGAYREAVERQLWPSVDAELSSYGHGEAMRRAYPQISTELSRALPACNDAIRQALATHSRNAAD